MQVTFTIDENRAPAVVDAVLVLHPKPDEGHPGHVEDQTDQQWVHRVLQQRFRRTLVALMKKARRDNLADPDPGIPDTL